MHKAVPMNILVVEDNEGDFILVSTFLQEAYPTAIIHHEEFLQTAIVAISNNEYNVILLDLSLPDSNGMQSVIEVVSVATHTPVIVLTGFGNKDFGIGTLASGVEDYLIKDEINPTILSKSINYSIERNRIHRELSKHQALFQALIEKSTDMKTLITPDGEILYGTPSITAILGYTEEDYLHKYEHDFIHPDDIETLYSAIDEVINHPGESAPLFLRVLHKNGTYRWCEKKVTNLLNDPNVSALVCNFWDITERMDHIREIEEQNALLKEIAWIQSHEVRAPMARIMGIVPLLRKQEYNLNPAALELVNYMLNSATDLDKIIKAIVDKTYKLEQQKKL